jgi:ATP-binding cassette subfamily C protein LapB
MTIIVSTHRLSLLSMVDRLLLFDKGRLVADGPRDKVIALLQGAPVPAAAAAPAPAPVPAKMPQPIVTVSGIRTSAAV